MPSRWRSIDSRGWWSFCFLRCGLRVWFGRRGTRSRSLRKIRQELADQILEHECRLGEIYLILVLQVSFSAPGGQADELAAQQSLSIDGCVAVRRNLVVFCV